MIGWTPAQIEAQSVLEAEDSLHFFVQLMWKVLEPETPFADGWWPRAWCSHLEAVEQGRITRLLANVPPGACKSLITNVFYPAWVWGPQRRPHTRFLSVSYSQTITERDNDRMRQLIQSDEYQSRWGKIFKCNDSKILLSNNRTGWKLATGIGGTVTGLRGDRFLCLPWESMILTDQGLIPIGRVVDERLAVRVAGWSGSAVEWQHIEAYQTNPGAGLIEIDFGSGVLRCTDEHPVWVEDRGYIPACEVQEGERLTIINPAMYKLWCDGEALRVPCEAEQGDILHPSLCAFVLGTRGSEWKLQRRTGLSYVPKMWWDIPTEARSEDGKLLLCEVWASGQSTPSGIDGSGLRALRQDVPTAQKLALALFGRVSGQDAGGEDISGSGRFVYPWRSGIPIPSGLEQQACGSDSRERPAHMPTVRDHERDTRPKSVSASYRLCERQHSSDQPDISVRAVSFEGSWVDRQQIGMESAIVRRVGRVVGVPGTVYNLRIGPHHNYFADGVLLHNCDDPNDIKASDSTIVREATNRWLSETMPTRLSSIEKSAIILIQQRTHQEDATGFLLDPKRGGDRWTYVMCPMLYDPDWTCGMTPIGWTDPRTERGELFWPERFSSVAVDTLRETMTDYAWASQMQQSPEPRGGAIIKRDWWRLYGNPDEDPTERKMRFPAFSYVGAFLDCALTDKQENDPSALLILGTWTVPQTGQQAVMLVNAWQDRLQLNPLVRRVADTCDRYRVHTLVIENKANGHSVEQEIRRLYQQAEWSVQFSDPSRVGEKVARAHSITHLFEEGLIWHPNTEWAQMVIDQAAIFPRGSHDDLVDCLTAGLRHLREHGILQRRQEARWHEQAMAATARDRAIPRPLYTA